MKEECLRMKNLQLGHIDDYTLLARVKEDNTVHEYIVAWCYDKQKDCWAQGHYFENLQDAMTYMVNKKLSKVGKRALILELMHEYIRTEISDENAYMTWINIVPDEPTKDDFDFISNDEDEWRQCAKMFGNLVKFLE